MPESPIASVEELAEAIVVHVLVTSLDEEELRRLQGAVRAAADANPGRPCVLDLARVEFLPSMSLAALIRLHTEFQTRQQRLALAALQPQVRDVFLTTRLDRLFELHDTVAAAAGDKR
jgi:anti-anti-sigma factor